MPRIQKKAGYYDISPAHDNRSRAVGNTKKLFFLIKHNLPVPTIGFGKNCYQMVSVFDCVPATIAAIQYGCPNKVDKVMKVKCSRVKRGTKPHKNHE
jgi:hypothetical protein